MRNLTDIAKQERARFSKDAFWILEIEHEGDTLYYGLRGLELGGVQYVAGLLGIGSVIERFIPGEALGEINAGLEFSNIPKPGSPDLSSLADLAPFEGRSCRVGLFLRDKAGLAGICDIVWIASFRIAGTSFSGERAVFSLVDPLARDAGKKLLRRLSPAILRGIEADGEGPLLPAIFGNVTECPLAFLPLEKGSGIRTKIAREILPEDVFLYIENASGLPPRGRIQLGEEIIEYRWLDIDTGKLGSVEAPLIRPEPSYHSEGEDAWFLPGKGLSFLVADHPCKSVQEIRSGGRSLEGAVVTNLELEGRNACVVNLEHWPAFSQNAPSELEARFSGDSWELLDASTAVKGERAVDGYPGVTSAMLAAGNNDLYLRFTRDLSNGGRDFGSLASVGIEVRYFSPKRPVRAFVMKLRVRKNEMAREDFLLWPEILTAKAVVPEQELRIQLESSPPSFNAEFPENSLNVCFDEAIGEEDLGGGDFRWKDSSLSRDGDFSSFSLNFSGPGISSNESPLGFRIHRTPMKCGAANLFRVHFHIVMDSCETPQKDVQASMRLANLFKGSTLFSVDDQKREYVYEVPIQNLEFDQLLDPDSSFELAVPDGSALRVYEAWLELVYTLIPPEENGEESSGYGEGILSPLEIDLPTPMVTHFMDVTKFIKENGGWAFFEGGSGGPLIEMEFMGIEDEVRISETALVTRYRPLVDVEMEGELTANVQGWHEGDVLYENPVDVIRLLLTDSRFLGYFEEEIDEASFEVIRSRLELEKAAISKRFRRDKTIKEAIGAILDENRIRLIYETGKFRLLGSRWNPSAPGESMETDFTLGEDLILNDESTLLEKNLETGVRQACFELPLSILQLERGDRVCFSSRSPLLDRALGEVAGFSLKDADLFELRVDLVQMGAILWEWGDFNLIRRLFGGEGFLFYIEKIAKARLEPSGDFCLLGELREGVLEEETISHTIVYDEENGRILFGAGEDAPYQLVLAIDVEGNLLTRGGLTEHFIPPGVTVDEFYKSFRSDGKDWFAISMNGQTPIFIAGVENVYLKGEIVER